MELKDFIANFASQFDETDKNNINSDTLFKELDEWSSLVALSIIAMVDDEYDVILKGEDIRNVHTIGELFEVVQSKIA